MYSRDVLEGLSACLVKRAFVPAVAKGVFNAGVGIGKKLGFGGIATTAFAAPTALSHGGLFSSKSLAPANSMRSNLVSPVTKNSPMGSLF